MIRKIRHKGLKRLYAEGDGSRVQPNHVATLEEILLALDQAERPGQMDLPGYRLHPLKGKRKGEWSVSVSGSWRVTFRFEGTDATDVDYEDYH